MKRILTIIFLLSAVWSYSQSNWNTTTQGGKTTQTYFLGSIKADSGILIPKLNSLTTNRFKDSLGAIAYNSDSLWMRCVSGWRNIGRLNALDTSFLVRYYRKNQVDSAISANTPALNLQDVTDNGYTTTDSIIAASFKRTGGTSIQFLKANGSVDNNTYLTLADTGRGTLQLATGGSLNKVKDSLASIITSISNPTLSQVLTNGNSANNTIQVNQVKAFGSGGLSLNSNGGTQIANLGAGGGSNATFYGFSGYNSNLASGYTTRSFTDKNYVDSSVATKGSGTVISIATGLGLSGGTITTSGTLLVDTASTSILSRQRAATTYQPLLTRPIVGTNGNLVSGYLTRAVAITGIDTSGIFQNGSNFGIGTTSPQTKLHIVGNNSVNEVTRFTNETAGTSVLIENGSTPTAARNAINFRQARGSLATPSTVQTDDFLGSILWAGYQDAYYSKLSIDGIVDGAVTSSTIPTALVFRTSATSATRAETMRLSSAGNFLLGNTTGTDKLTVTGNLNLNTAGNKLKIATGTNASVGVSSAMTAGTITISTTAVTSSSRIFLTHATLGGTQGILSVGTIVNGTSFVINSSSILDTGTVNWFIIN
jgi:hypothetical protein